MNAGEKIKNTYIFSKVDKFIWNWFQLNKTFLIDTKNYFQRSEKFSQIFRNVFRLNFPKN